MRALDLHNIEGYYDDLKYIGRLGGISESTRDWIETTMYELRGKANVYECRLGELLMAKNIKFIHQAPFVFMPMKIHFVDFYLPEYRMVLEVDGNYHDSSLQIAKDQERDQRFKDIGIRVVRVENEETRSPDILSLRLSQFLPTA